MTDAVSQPFPEAYANVDAATRASGFTMASDALTGSLLRTLAASKPNGQFLELGTGTGLSTSWILDGMDAGSTLVSVDNDPKFLDIANQFLGKDTRLQLVCSDGEEWINKNGHQQFDYIFADTWHGKYLLLEEGLSLLKKGGFYILDDMLPQPNWPEGHQEKASRLIAYLDTREDLTLTRQVWSTGIILIVKK